MACTTPAPVERDPVCACSLYPYDLFSGLDELETVIRAWSAVADLTSPVIDPGPDLHSVDRENLYLLLNLLATLARWHLARHNAEISTGGKS